MVRQLAPFAVASTRLWIDPPGHYAPGIIVVDGDSIGEILPLGARSTLGDMACLDLGDRPVLPGLINTHVHLEFSASSSPLREFEREAASERLMRAIGNARELLESETAAPVSTCLPWRGARTCIRSSCHASSCPARRLPGPRVIFI